MSYQVAARWKGGFCSEFTFSDLETAIAKAAKLRAQALANPRLGMTVTGPYPLIETRAPAKVA